MRSSVAPARSRAAARPTPWGWLGVVAAVLAYLPTLRFGFVFDDIDAVVRNTSLRGLSALPHVLTIWQREAVHYRPLRYLSLAIDWNLGGGAPWVFHLTNVLLHAACAVLLGAVILRLLGSRPLAGATALLFALLPSHAATVAYVSGRKDLLATAFYLLAALAFLIWRRSGRPRDAVLGVGAGVLAAFSKETAATLPLSLVLMDAWMIARERPGEAGTPWRALGAAVRARARWYATWLLLGGLFIAYVLVIWPATKVPVNQWGHVWTHVGTALRIWPTALAQLLLPWRTIPDRLGMIQVGAGWSAWSLWGLCLTAALVAAAFRLRHARPGASVGIAFLLVSWLPTAGIIPIAEVFAEHYLYLPSCGACLALACLLVPPLESWTVATPAARRASRTRTLQVAATVAGLGLAAWCFGLSRVWANERAVWEASARANPYSFRAAVNLSGVYLDDGRTAAADSLARRAVALAPDAPVATAQLVSTLVESGRPDAAADVARRGLERFPQAPELQEALAVALVAAQRPAEAAPVLAALVARRGAGISPYLLGMYGQSLYQLGRAAQAETVLTRAIAADSTYSQAWTNLGLARWALGRTADAELALRRAIAIAPSDPDPHNSLAVLLLQSGRVQEAAEHARISVRLGRPLHPDFEQALRAALAQLPPPAAPGGG